MLPSRRDLLQLAWPLVLAQSATALPGVVDTLVMGRFGDRYDLAAVAIASVTFSFLYWGFGFLRMATTGLTARARGAGDEAESRAILLRAGALSAVLGLGLWLFVPVVRLVLVAVFAAEPVVDTRALAYVDARILGAPAALGGFAMMGWLLGRGRTRALLGLQLVLNLTNAALDGFFVGVWGWGAAGIGAGTAIAEWLAFGVGLWLVRDGFHAYAPLLDREKLAALFTANVDILVRTVALLTAFAWFTQAGTRLGSETVAGNQVLLQFIAVSAFVLDAFAFLTEKEAGEAVGAQDARRLRHVLLRTTELSFVFGGLFTVVYLAVGPSLITWAVTDPAARQTALDHLPWCALVPLIGIPAWQLDGLFLGTTRGRALRNAAVASTLAYITLDLSLRSWANTGVWGAFVAMYVFRAAFLAFGIPGLVNSMQPERRS